MPDPNYPLFPQINYYAMPFQFPLSDPRPVVRIPVAGPEPYNTLVVVRSAFYVGRDGWANGRLQRRTIACSTNFSLIGYDPRVPAIGLHSTAASLTMLQVSDDTPFATAVDAIDDAFFDETGRWTVIIRVADLFDQVYASALGFLSSWVLCYEPPPPENYPYGKNPLIKPIGLLPVSNGGTRLVQPNPPDPTPSGAKLEAYVRKSARRRAKELRCKNAPGRDDE